MMKKYMNRTVFFNPPPDCMKHNKKKYTTMVKFSVSCNIKNNKKGECKY